MMIISHGAAAVLATVAYNQISRRPVQLTGKTIAKLFLFGVLPDLPLTALVLANKFDSSVHYHHKWITHTPIFWLAVSLFITMFFSRKAGLAVLTATWLHLGMDWYGGADGIPFLYPFSNRQFGVAFSRMNGPEGLKAYFSNPIFLFLELLVQGTFLAIMVSTIRKYSFQKQSPSNSG